jgi:hypothetical protein
MEEADTGDDDAHANVLDDASIDILKGDDHNIIVTTQTWQFTGGRV